MTDPRELSDIPPIWPLLVMAAFGAVVLMAAVLSTLTICVGMVWRAWREQTRRSA